MEIQTAQILNDVTSRFYATFAASFSATRANPWEGWERLADELRPWVESRVGQAESCVRALDIGGGNGRFERFLMRTFPHTRWLFTVADNCSELAKDAQNDEVGYRAIDLVDALIRGNRLPFADGTFDLVVSFGFAHHVPGAQARGLLLSEMARVTAPQGLFAASFWRFMDDERIARKAPLQTAERLAFLAACGTPVNLDGHDYLLGWKDATPAEGAVRYCHGFSDGEIDAIIARASEYCAGIRTRFDADGRSGCMNTYLVFER